MRTLLLPILAAAAAATSAQAVTIFSENFDSATGLNSGGINYSERYYIPDFRMDITIPGWTVVGSNTDILVVASHTNPSDKAIWLNETGSPSISRSIAGFTPGTEYTLTFDHWGDNVPGTYGFDVLVGGNLTQVTRTFSSSVTDPAVAGTFVTDSIVFTAAGASIDFVFADSNLGTPSGIVDNIRITAKDPTGVPDASAPGVLLGIGIAGIGLFKSRSRGVAAA